MPHASKIEFVVNLYITAHNQASILPTFCTKVLWAAFLLFQFDFVIFCQKNIGEKAARKMLVKLTTGRCFYFRIEHAFINATYINFFSWNINFFLSEMH